MAERGLIIFFRVSIGWIFLHAGFSQVMEPHFSVTLFLSHTKTFHDVFAIFTAPGIAPVISFIVEWGQVLLGLSLVSGAFIRVSTVFGTLLMMIFYFAHMDWPYDENRFYFIVGPNLIYAAVLLYLLVKRAGHVFGIDGVLARFSGIAKHPRLNF